ncbi:MAG: hypothetical protein M1274_03965 [Actinobacteria bacterium]|nr:hypothetical protein [Actinomycetota bacterium]
METQLQLPHLPDALVRVDPETLRRRLSSLPPARLYDQLTRHDGKCRAELWALAVIAAEVIEGAKGDSDRRRLLWALAQLNADLERLPQAIDAYRAATAGLKAGGNAFVLVCARARAFCLSRLGFKAEAAAEYARFRRAAMAYPLMVQAELERDLGAWHEERGLQELALENYTIAAAHYRASGYERGALSCDLDRGATLMFSARPKEAVRVIARARHSLQALGESEQVTQANELLEELFAYWNKPRRRLAAARRAYQGHLEQEDEWSAAESLADCAQSLARLGRDAERDRAYSETFGLLAHVAVEDERSAAITGDILAGLRLEYADYLVEDDRFREALIQVAAAAEELSSLGKISPRRFARAFSTTGRAREALGKIPFAGDVSSDCSPPQEHRVLSIDDPQLLLHLGQRLALN